MNASPYTGSRPRYSQPSATQFLATFGYAWFTIGLFTGTLVLVVAVRGVLDLIHRFGWGQAAQNRVLIGVIILFVAGSFLLARRVVRALYRQPPRTRRIALAALALPAILSGYAWSNPTKFLASFAGTESSSFALKGGPTFMFGSYPDQARLQQLKAQGVTAIVSLQSPTSLVEISGITEERRATASIGMRFIEAPMLPWVSNNEASLEMIRELARKGEGTYYVHCGLGRDRVNIVKRVIESMETESNARIAATTDLKRALGFDMRTEEFERGLLMKVKDGAWVVPFPNKEEFFGFIIQGNPGHVLLVLDPRDGAQKRWMTESDAAMTQYAVKHTLVAYPATNGDTSTARILAQVRAMKGPYTVIVAKTTWNPGLPEHPVARAIAQAYNVTAERRPSAVQGTQGEMPGIIDKQLPAKKS